MKFMNIASGSSGNSSLVGTDSCTVLVDSGISMKKIEAGLKKADLSFSDVDAILITHEHSDHIRSLGTILRKYEIPVYATGGTIEGIRQSPSTGDFDDNLLNQISKDAVFSLKDLTIRAHPISHDAREPVCFRLEEIRQGRTGQSVSIATDLGCYDENLVHFLEDSDVMLIETNHDVRMLEAGPYPFPLKRRIVGKKGHLSNEDGGKLIKSLLNDHIREILLGHLSRENNLTELAYETVKCELSGNAYSQDVRDFHLSVADRRTGSEMITF